ncbi:hypothetical protein ACIPJG_32210 [Streptomyces halstedii]|uniref:hypothetical protein n=1 Tax=Streptomyces halstedii TaxID=1944 RepID=UPI00380A3312
MFIVGDRVEVIVEDDPFYLTQGKVMDIYASDSGWRNLCVLLDNTEDIGRPWLWYSHNELRKVESA